jgi:hypothetical protein
VSNRPTRIDPMVRVAEPTTIMNRLSLTAPILARIGAIAVLASNVEHATERTVSALGRHNQSDKRRSLDERPIGEQIKALAEAGSLLPPSDVKNLLTAWCQTAESAFKCRESIFHGFALSDHSEWASSLKSARCHGANRKRASSGVHAGEHTLASMEQVFAVLYRVLVTIEWIVRQRKMEIAENTARAMLSALHEASSVSRGLEDLTAVINHEKS